MPWLFLGRRGGIGLVFFPAAKKGFLVPGSNANCACASVVQCAGVAGLYLKCRRRVTVVYAVSQQKNSRHKYWGECRRGVFRRRRGVALDDDDNDVGVCWIRKPNLYIFFVMTMVLTE
jgi:hypothetical protein